MEVPVGLITGNVTPEPACVTEDSVKQAGEWSIHPIELGTDGRLPSHPTQKIVEPQTAVCPFWGSSAWHT